MFSIKFSEKELTDLLWAWAAISFAFAVSFSGGFFGLGRRFPSLLFLSGFTVGAAFLFHEMGHKFAAQKYGHWAEFRKFDVGLIMAVFLSFFGFIIAAPGAVMISGAVTNEESGKISAAGPASNLVLAAFIFILGALANVLKISAPLLGEMISLGIMINLWLALFNLIPIFPLDGSKIVRWSSFVWVALVAVSFSGLIGLGFF